jgi:endo-1,4-beta-xylanase
MNINKIASIVAVSAGIFAVTACGGKSMRKLAAERGLDTGYALAAGDIYPEKTVKILQNDCNIITSENCMKWGYMRPKKDFWNWGDPDALVAFAEKNGMKVKWHTLAWHQSNPPFLADMKTRADGIAMLDDYITTIMTRYKGRIYAYDVINEMFNEDGTLRDTIWLETIGPDYIEHALQTAHAADPAAKLYLNEYNNEAAGYAKSDAMYAMVKDFKERGVPIDGIGMQLHLAADQPFDEAAVRRNLQRYAAIGIDVSFSEVDVRKKVDGKPESAQAQQDLYCRLMRIALEEKNVKSFICWGFSDIHSWVPASFPGYGEALFYNTALKPKLVYKAVVKTIAENHE